MSISEVLQALESEQPTIEHNFGAMEEPILALLLDHPEAVGDAGRFITPKIFTQGHTIEIAHAIYTAHEQYGVMPTRAVVMDRMFRRLTVDDMFWREIEEFLTRYKCDTRDYLAAQSNLQLFIHKRLLAQLHSDAVLEAQATMEPTEYAKLVNTIMAEVARFERGEQKDTFTWSDLIAANPDREPPIIDGLVREGQIMNVVSSSKAGKSWMCYGIAMAVLSGRKWLDEFPTTKGKVLLIDNELSPQELSHRTRKVAENMGIDIGEYGDQLVIKTLKRKPQSLSELAGFFEGIQPHEFRLIILDAMYKFCEPKSDENSNADMSRFYAMLSTYAEQTKAAILLVHHSTKGDQSDKRITDVGAGAGSQSRAADCHLIFREHAEGDAMVLDATVRSFPPIEPLAVRFNWPLWEPDRDLDPTQLATGTARRRRAATRKACGPWPKPCKRAAPQLPANCEPKPEWATSESRNYCTYWASK